MSIPRIPIETAGRFSEAVESFTFPFVANRYFRRFNQDVCVELPSNSIPFRAAAVWAR